MPRDPRGPVQWQKQPGTRAPAGAIRLPPEVAMKIKKTKPEPFFTLTRESMEAEFGQGIPSPDAGPMLSYRWRCDSCNLFTDFDTPSRPPDPCPRCGCITHEKIRLGT